MPTYVVRHVTTYRYASPVSFGEHRIMLRPQKSADQRTQASVVSIAPEPVETVWAEDASGNVVGRAKFDRAAPELRFEARIEVHQESVGLDMSKVAPHARTCPFSYTDAERSALSPFLEPQHPDPSGRLARWALEILAGAPARDTCGFLLRLNGAVQRNFAYRRRLEMGVQDPVETLRLGSGSCRDFAVLTAEAARSVGIAARFASGYLHVPSSEPDLAEIGGHTHAWVQVYVPGPGWVDLDPTSGSIGNSGLIRVASVIDPEHACPVAGTFFGQPEDFLEMSVHVDVSVIGQPGNSCQNLRPAEA